MSKVKATCIGIMRDYEAEKNITKLTAEKSSPVIKGYILRELDEDGNIKSDKDYIFPGVNLVEHMTDGNLEVSNLKVTKLGSIEKKETQIINEDTRTEKFANKSIVLGYEVRKIFTDCGHVCYLASKGDEHILRISENVIAPIIRIGNYSHFEDELQKLRGELQVIGGSGIINGTEMFNRCVLNKLDLGLFDTSSLEITQDMFYNSHITDIEFNGKCKMSKVKNMDGMFKCFDGTYIIIDDLDTTNVKTMKNMFENCNCNEVFMRNLDIQNVISMEGMFLDATMGRLDISKWVITNVPNTKYIFKDFEIVDELILSEKDRENKRIMKFRACWSKEEREAHPRNDWYHQIKKAEKYGYGYNYW